MEEELLLRLRKSSACSSRLPTRTPLHISRSTVHRAWIRYLPCTRHAPEHLPAYGCFHGSVHVAWADHPPAIGTRQPTLRASTTLRHHGLHGNRHRLDCQRSTRSRLLLEGARIRKTHNWPARNRSSLR